MEIKINFEKINKLVYFKVAPKVGRGSLHVDRGDLERDSLQFSQEIQIHEILLWTEQHKNHKLYFEGNSPLQYS